ncbi:RRP8 [Lepeophtheirus salmonis]|uniref:Ribosomal RNA-processing protein 8 n=1 Tax=Lepeophtheirus salmonis TaxID=72036 RepID=A0A7R8CZD4_LEPSM|nr:RRP8 [Lepeophtheirus salmonis]CAF2975084.1 RRP8 [Lepeophtheirus salmonis]
MRSKEEESLEADKTSSAILLCGAKSMKKSLSHVFKKPQKNHILRRGIRFSSPEEFESYIQKQILLSRKNDKKRKVKRKRGNLHEFGLRSPWNIVVFSKKSPTQSRRPQHMINSVQPDSAISMKNFTRNRAPYPKKMFRQDPEAFQIYHQGYANQINKWPIDPLDCIVSSMMRKSESAVVVDMGCGEARLARLLPSQYRRNNFTLNYQPPVAKINGTLKIAEVESRFRETTPEKFTTVVEKIGFKLKWKDLSKKVFYLMDFKKVSSCSTLKIPQLNLKPCIYKKR